MRFKLVLVELEVDYGGSLNTTFILISLFLLKVSEEVFHLLLLLQLMKFLNISKIKFTLILMEEIQFLALRAELFLEFYKRKK